MHRSPRACSPSPPRRNANAGANGERNGDWPNRTLYLTLGKLFVDVLKLVTYMAYFLILFYNYGMPLIMVRRGALPMRCV